MGAGAVLDVLVGVVEWLLNRARPQPAPPKQDAVSAQRAAWEARVAARKGR